LELFSANSYGTIRMAQRVRFLRGDKDSHPSLQSARISCIRTLHPSPALYNHLNYSQDNPYLQDSTDAHHALHKAFQVFSFLTFLFVLSLLNDKNRPILFTRIDTINRSFDAIGIRPDCLQILLFRQNREAAQQEPFTLFARLRKEIRIAFKRSYFFFLSAAARIWEGWFSSHSLSSSSLSQSDTWPIWAPVL
jgi:hypothetical protein